MLHPLPLHRAMRLLGSIAILTLAQPAAADQARGDTSGQDESRDDALARTLFESGRAYFERAKYEEAAQAFDKAYRLSGRPALLINQARALEAGGQVSEAIEVLEQFEEAAPEEDPMRATVAAMLRRLRAVAAQRSRDSDAREEGDDAEVAPEAAAPAGPVTIEPDTSRSDKRAVLRWSGIGALSFAGLSAAVAIGTGVASRSIYNSLEADCPNDVCPVESQADIDRGRRLGVASTVFTFVGLGAAVTGAVLLVLGMEPGDEEASPPRARLTGGPGLAGAGLHLSF